MSSSIQPQIRKHRIGSDSRGETTSVKPPPMTVKPLDVGDDPRSLKSSTSLSLLAARNQADERVEMGSVHFRAQSWS